MRFFTIYQKNLVYIIPEVSCDNYSRYRNKYFLWSNKNLIRILTTVSEILIGTQFWVPYSKIGVWCIIEGLSRRLFMVPTLPNSFLAFPRPLKRKKAEVMGKSCSHLSPLPNSMALEPIALSTAIAMISSCLPFVSPSNFCYPAIFNFGDSNSDTGGLVAGIAFPVWPPNGQTYFLKPSGRLCDGRLTIDFLSNVFLSFWARLLLGTCKLSILVATKS